MPALVSLSEASSTDIHAKIAPKNFVPESPTVRRQPGRFRLQA